MGLLTSDSRVVFPPFITNLLEAQTPAAPLALTGRTRRASRRWCTKVSF